MTDRNNHMFVESVLWIDIASKMRRHYAFVLQGLKRRNTVFQSPKTSGRSRHGEPVRTAGELVPAGAVAGNGKRLA